MVSVIRQRTIVCVAMVSAGLAFFWAAGNFGGASIGSLLAGPAPAGTAVLRFTAASLAAIVVAGLASALTRPISGPMVLGAALCFAAVRAGSIDPWLRQIGGSGAYWTMVSESVLWGVWLVGSCTAASLVARAVRGALGGTGELRAETSRAEERSSGMVAELVKITGLSEGTVQSAGGLIVAVVVEGVVVWLLAVTPYAGQVLGGALVAGLAGAMTGCQVFPRARPTALLVSPVVTGAVWYGRIAMSGLSRRAMLEQYFQTPTAMWHAGLVPPIYWAAAGLAGAALGLAWAEAMGGSEQGSN